MTAQNILAGLDDWLQTWTGEDNNLIKPEIKPAANMPEVAANEPAIRHQGKADSAAGTITFHNSTRHGFFPSTRAREATVTEPATTASAPAQVIELRPLADAYYRHHFGCLHCIAAGQNPRLNRCMVGSPLWQAYQAVSIQNRKAQNHD